MKLIELSSINETSERQLLQLSFDFQEPVLLEDEQNESENENTREFHQGSESEGTCSTSDDEETEDNSNFSKEDRKLQRKVVCLLR